MIDRVELGKRVEIPYPDLVNLYCCHIGDDTFIGPFVEIQSDVKIGKRCRIQSHTFICSGVDIGNGVFIGHGVMFVNDKFPKANKDWKLLKTYVGDGSSIGNNATILPVKIGKNCLIGAGSVVTKNVPNNSIVKGNPAK